MTTEEKILYRLKKAHRKEQRLAEALKKIEPPEPSEPTHDPEILTPEEHFYLLKMGRKCKNYVPVGRRGIFQGVILNMHLHWKKHQTVKIIVKTFTPEEVREIAVELARLSGGIVLDIVEENTIIMYRGKNYVQPPTEIMSPKVTLSRKKALDKSKYRDALRGESEHRPASKEETASAKSPELLEKSEAEISDLIDSDDSSTESVTFSESEDLSDIFETDSEGQTQDELDRPLYLDTVERFPSQNDGEAEDFEEHLRKIASVAKTGDSTQRELKAADLDEVDRIFLRASSLLKNKR
uniref:CRM domain-containing protein n=1 Tax=Ananas comosus var. bracteatus TaxID=296719 RepID=A0A6V7P1A0_ANACO|nr:unnamed protein product [Ananas comosus var. bracteatus]